MTLPRPGQRSVSNWDFDRACNPDCLDDDSLSLRVFDECGGRQVSYTPTFQDFEPFFNWMARPQMSRRAQYEMAQIERERFNQPGPGNHCFGPGSRSSFNFEGPRHPLRSDYEMPRAPYQRDEGAPVEPFYVSAPYKAPNIPDLKIQPLLNVGLNSRPGTGRNWESEFKAPETKSPVVPVSYTKPDYQLPRYEIPVYPEGPDAPEAALEKPISWRQDTLSAYEEAIYQKRPLVILFGDDGELFERQYREMSEDKEGRYRRMSQQAVWVVGKPRYDETAGHIKNYLSIKNYPTVSVLEPNNEITPRVILEGYFEPRDMADQLEYYLGPNFVPPPSPKEEKPLPPGSILV